MECSIASDTTFAGDGEEPLCFFIKHAVPLLVSPVGLGSRVSGLGLRV